MAQRRPEAGFARSSVRSWSTTGVVLSRFFYREAGHAGAPVLVLLHGYPTSSHMFRALIPLLADKYHVVAPDHLGFGLSDAPTVDEFDYSFDALTQITAIIS
jgi:pimeloyl-ACP methyl ester carboxylesterase